MRSGRPDGGFTLVELLVVLAIVGMMAGLVGPALYRWQERLEARGALSDLEARLAALPVDSFIGGRARVLDEAALLAELKEFPAGAKISLPQPLRYSVNGACSGGEVLLTLPDGSRWRFRVAKLTGEVTREPV